MSTVSHRTTLVLGAGGQDGRLLSTRLLQSGDTVLGVIRPDGDERRLVPGVRPIAVDIANGTAVAELIATTLPTQIYHMAAVHEGSEGGTNDQLGRWGAMVEVNFLSTLHVISGVLRHCPSATLVYAASSQMYQTTDADLRVDEVTPRHPANFYALTKSWSMDAIGHARRRHGLRGATAILFNHESVLRSPTFVSRKITAAAAALARGSKDRLKLLNIGARVDWSAAEDVVDALIRIAEHQCRGDYVVGSGKLHSVKDLLDAAFACVGIDWRPWVDFESERPRPAVFADATQLTQDTGWNTSIPFSQMIKQMVDADSQPRESRQRTTMMS